MNCIFGRMKQILLFSLLLLALLPLNAQQFGRKELGGDRMHDYFYHNLGQHMTLTAIDGSDLNLKPTEELAFAGF